MAPQLGSFHLSHPAGFCCPWFEQELPIDAAPGALLMLAIGLPFATDLHQAAGLQLASVLQAARAETRGNTRKVMDVATELRYYTP